MFKRVPGTRDILPDQIRYWQKVEEISRSIFARYNYKEIRLPLLEDAGLFNRSLGETAEIVQKQMFIIKAHDDVYALRPEATAAVVRAYIENNLDKTSLLQKLYYMGPMFRYERPQKGRLRQFHHIGCETIGSAGPEIDIEIITLADTLLKAYGIAGHRIRLNSLGCQKDRETLRGVVKNGLEKNRDRLCPDCQQRFDRNILRILDCKNEGCRELVKGLPLQPEGYLCGECAAHFQSLRGGLDSLGIPYEVDALLVRGLDYYTRTVFEINHPSLGAQDAIGAGGRYDTLVPSLGGPDVGSIGFALGMERVLLAMDTADLAPEKGLVYLVSMGQAARSAAVRLLCSLREAGITADTDYENKSVKGAFRKAGDMGASFVVIIGEDELKNNTVMLKDMKSGTQKQVAREQLIAELKG